MVLGESISETDKRLEQQVRTLDRVEATEEKDKGRCAESVRSAKVGDRASRMLIEIEVTARRAGTGA